MTLSSVPSDDQFDREESNSKDDPISLIIKNPLLPGLFDHFAAKLGDITNEKQR